MAAYVYKAGPHTCPKCGDMFERRGGTGSYGNCYCQPCDRAVKRAYASSCDQPPRIRDGRKAADRKKRDDGECRRCGASLAGLDFKAIYCSKQCGWSAKQAGRRANGTRGRPFSLRQRYEVYDRDDWVCQICGDPVNPKKLYPAPDAPTLDHRIPRSKGGTDELENMQTAHAYCNRAKRSTVGFEFAEASECLGVTTSTS